MFSAMKYENGVFQLVDQRILPVEESWLEMTCLEDVAMAIETMVVRGAPAIGCAAAFGMAIVSRQTHAGSFGEFKAEFEQAVARLARTRPTAVNLFYALTRVQELAKGFSPDQPIKDVQTALEQFAVDLFEEDIGTCKAMGEHGADAIGDRPVNILTHCNTGSLATAGYGTALGVIRSLHARGLVKNVYADETRPWLQGARLTAYELMQDNIPCKLIADSTAAWLMQNGGVDVVVTGADRIASNGDTANKIGTYSLAVNCAHHKIPFYIAAPLTTFDFELECGEQIPVEEREGRELTHSGERQIAPNNVETFNPSFDVTPSALIAGIITEKGVLRPPYRTSIGALHK